MNGDSAGLNLAYPLYEVPSAGDAFTAQQGCDKTLATCKTVYNNLQHRRAYDFVPPPDTVFKRCPAQRQRIKLLSFPRRREPVASVRERASR